MTQSRDPFTVKCEFSKYEFGNEWSHTKNISLLDINKITNEESLLALISDSDVNSRKNLIKRLVELKNSEDGEETKRYNEIHDQLIELGRAKIASANSFQKAVGAHFIIAAHESKYEKRKPATESEFSDFLLYERAKEIAKSKEVYKELSEKRGLSYGLSKFYHPETSEWKTQIDFDSLYKRVKQAEEKISPTPQPQFEEKKLPLQESEEKPSIPASSPELQEIKFISAVKSLGRLPHNLRQPFFDEQLQNEKLNLIITTMRQANDYEKIINDKIMDLGPNLQQSHFRQAVAKQMCMTIPPPELKQLLEKKPPSALIKWLSTHTRIWWGDTGSIKILKDFVRRNPEQREAKITEWKKETEQKHTKPDILTERTPEIKHRPK